MLHGQAAMSKCHCFRILRAKRDETIKKMKKRALDKAHADGTLSPWAPPDYIPLARARPGPRAVTRATFAFRPQIHSWGSYVGKYVRTYAKGWGGGEKAADWAQKHTCRIHTYVRKYVSTYVRTSVMPPLLRSASALSSLARLPPGRSPAPQWGTADLQAIRCRPRPYSRPPRFVFQPTPFGKRPFRCPAPSGTALFPPAPRAKCVRTYVVTYGLT